MWWQYVIGAIALALIVYAFLAMTGWQTRMLSRRTSRRAESMYASYADSTPRQRRFARRHGDRGTDDEER